MNHQLPTAEENPNGLHAKYSVSYADGSPIDPSQVFFALRISGGKDKLHNKACRCAAMLWAELILMSQPEMSHMKKTAEDLLKTILSIEEDPQP
jgi:hypothetical protein